MQFIFLGYLSGKIKRLVYLENWVKGMSSFIFKIKKKWVEIILIIYNVLLC